MQSVVIQDVEWRDEFGKKLFELQQTGQFCDVIIKTVEDARLLVHSCVLAAASPLLKGVIESALNDTTLGTIMLSSDIDVNTWTHMLEFMYTGGATVPDSLVASLQSGATILKVDTLVERCNEILPTIVTKIEEPIPSETQDIYSAIAQIKEDNDAVVEQESVEGKIATEEGIMVMTTEAMVEGSIITQEDHAVESAEGIPDNTEATVIDDGGVQEADVGIAEEQDAVDETAVVPETHETLDAQDAMDTQDYIDDVHDGDGTPEYIVVPNTSVASDKGHVEDGYQAALDFLMTNNIAIKSEEEVRVVPNTVGRERPPGQLVIKNTEFELIGYTEEGKAQYRCCLCSTLCMDPSVHRYMHTEERPFMCDYRGCGKSYKSKPALKQHVMCHHAVSASHRCIKCGKVFKTDYLLKKHIAITCNDARPYICRTCGKPFKTIGNLRYHEGTHSSVKPYQCVHCHKTMPSKAHLKAHMLTHDEGNFVCFCGKRYKNSKRYKEHFKFIHDVTNPNRCDICNKNFKNAIMLAHHKESHKRPYQCRVCKKGFSKAVNCHIHETMRHQELTQEDSFHKTSEEETTCPECEKKFRSKRAMLSHLDQHRISMKFACEVCGKKYKSRKQIQSHMLSHAEATVPCPKCNKMFKDDRAVQIHLLSHTKPFECEICGARYASAKYLQKHEEYHKKGIKLKTYNCPWCAYVFPTLSNVRMHIEEVHPKQLLENKGTNLKALIGTGVRKPKNETPLKRKDQASKPMKIYNCELCPAVLPYESSLITHEIRAHAQPGMKIPCNLCDVKFITPRTLKKHKYSCHEIGELLSCKKCKREFYSTKDLCEHNVVVHERDTTQLNVNESENQDLTVGRSPLHICIVCCKYLSNAKDLQEHEHAHTSKEFVCRICHSKFLSIETLKVHCENCSETQCMYCCQKFNAKSELLKHLKFHQMGKIIYKCFKCSKEFSNVLALREHKAKQQCEFKHSAKDGLQTEKKVAPKFGGSYKSLLSSFVK